MSTVHSRDKKPPKEEFAVESNLISLKKAIWQVAYVQNFGLRLREIKTPRNAEQWSKESLERYMTSEHIKKQKCEMLDREFLTRKRNTLDSMLTRLSYHIQQANNIKYAVSMAECDERRINQDRALGDCEALRIELQDIMDIVPTNKNWMSAIEKYIDREVKLIEGWRKSDGRIRRAVRKKELAQSGGADVVKKCLAQVLQDMSMEPEEEPKES